MGTIAKVTAGGATHLIASSAYGECTTAAATAAKTVNLTGDGTATIPYTLMKGNTIHVKFTNTNTAASPTLDVNSTGAKAITKYGATAAGTTEITSWSAGAVVAFTYDGTRWIMNDYVEHGDLSFVETVTNGIKISYTDSSVHNYSVPILVSNQIANGLISPYYGSCSTAAATAIKQVDCTGYTLKTGSWIAVKFTVTNTAAVANLQLSVEQTDAKSIKYRGGNLPSVGSLAAGRVYLFVYDGTNYELIGDLDTNTDTKNTAGSTDSSSKLFLIGATSQAANPQTYSHDTAYVGTDGCLYSGGTKVLTAHQTYTAFTGKPTANQTPGFGSTFTISQISQSASGQVSGTDRTVTIPNATATTSTAGLMSADDKEKLSLIDLSRFDTGSIASGGTYVDLQTPNGTSYLVSYFAWDDTTKEEVVLDVSLRGDGVYRFSAAAAVTNAIYVKGLFI